MAAALSDEEVTPARRRRRGRRGGGGGAATAAAPDVRAAGEVPVDEASAGSKVETEGGGSSFDAVVPVAGEGQVAPGGPQRLRARRATLRARLPEI